MNSLVFDQKTTDVAKLDAGQAAKEKLTVKQAAIKTAYMVRFTILSFIGFFLLGLAGYGAWAWEHRVQSAFTDYRTCSVKVGNKEVTGTRSFTYPFTEVLGYRFIDTKHIHQETKIDIRGDAITIVGTQGDKWWAIPVGTGERGVQLLKPADAYTFVIDGKDAGVIEYNSFCR